MEDNSTHSSTHDTGASHQSHHHETKSHSAPKAKLTFNKTFFQYLSGILTILLLLSIALQYDVSLDITKSSGLTGAVVADDSDKGTAGAAVAVDLDTFYDEDDPVLGDPDAPVTIVEFSDFQCPYCGRFYSDAYQSIKENYVDTGKVKFVFRDFPLSFHPEARPAAIAAECADDQEKFWEFHDMIFENQGSLSESNYLAWAEELGLDVDDFTTCITEETFGSEVDTDFAEGSQLGVSGTPAFFVNGQKVVGAQPYAVFQAAIEAALN